MLRRAALVAIMRHNYAPGRLTVAQRCDLVARREGPCLGTHGGASAPTTNCRCSDLPGTRQNVCAKNSPKRDLVSNLPISRPPRPICAEACKAVGVRKVDHGLWQVSFIGYWPAPVFSTRGDVSFPQNMALSGDGGLGKGTAFESPCPSQQCREPRSCRDPHLCRGELLRQITECAVRPVPGTQCS
jgi:hypothetical protein